MRIAKIMLALALLLVIVQAAMAEEARIGVDTQTINKYIINDTDVARYNIVIINIHNESGHFRIDFPDEAMWTILTEPEIYYKSTGFDLDAGESIKMVFAIKPKRDAIMSGVLNINTQYQIPFKVYSESTDASEEDFITVYYGPKFGKPTYAPAIQAELIIPDKIDPRQGIEARVLVKNRNPLNVSRLDIRVVSALMYKEAIISLAPYKEKTVLLTQALDPLQAPMDDKLTAELIYNGIVIDMKQKDYSISAYSQFEEEKTTERLSFFETAHYLKYRNNGNVQKTETVMDEIQPIKTLFVSADPDAKLQKQDGKTYLAWDLLLEPNETRVITVTENYLAIIILIILAIGLFIAWNLVKSPVNVVKTATLLSKKEGGISGIKVIISIKNTSEHAVHELEIVDSIPNLVEIDKNVEMGHIAPANIVNSGSKGLLIKWKVGDLEKGEERIVSYKARAKLTILGSITLPAAVIRFISGYKERIVYSNRLKIKL